MIKFETSDPLTFLPPEKTSALTDPLIIEGVLKDATASSVQFAAGNFTQWLTLPTALIERVTYLGAVEGGKENQGMQLPLFSIALKRPQTQSDLFFFNLVMPPFFSATQNLSVPVIVTDTELI